MEDLRSSFCRCSGAIIAGLFGRAIGDRGAQGS